MIVALLRPSSPSTFRQKSSSSSLGALQAEHASRGTMAFSGSGLPQAVHDVRIWRAMARIRECESAGVRECESGAAKDDDGTWRQESRQGGLSGRGRGW
jgi:hypothetical protein